MMKSRHSLITKGIMILLSLFILFFISSYSWFASRAIPSTASGLSVKTTGNAEFDVAVGFKTSENGYRYLVSDYTDSEHMTLNFDDLKVTDLQAGTTQTYSLLHDFSPKDLTGNGATLIRPSLTKTGGIYEINTTTDAYSVPTPGKEYISFDLIFKSNKECNIYLDNGSYVKGACEGFLHDYTSLTGATPLRKSTYGTFSEDALIGSLRVACVGYDSYGAVTCNTDDTASLNTTANPTLLWLPRPDIKLNTNNTTNGWTLSTGLTSGTSFTHTYYDVGTHSTVGYPNTTTSLSSAFVTNVNSYDDETEMYYGKTRVNIWLEGCDEESRRAIAGGQFSISLNLKAG